MATRKADDTAGVEPDTKAKTEDNTEETCLAVPNASDELSKEAFNAAMAFGLAQARAGLSAPVDEDLDRLIAALSEG